MATPTPIFSATAGDNSSVAPHRPEDIMTDALNALMMFDPAAHLSDGVTHGGITPENIRVIPAVRVRQAAGQNIPAGLPVLLTWDTEDFDTDTMHDLGANTDRLTCVTGGIHLIILDVQFAFDSAGIRGLIVKLNGGAATIATAWYMPTTLITSLHVSTLYRLAPGDYVGAFAYHSLVHALSLDATAGATPCFSALWVAP